MVTLAFGRRIPRQRPIANPTLSDEQRQFEGDCNLFVMEASWRLDGKDAPICSSTDGNEVDGAMVQGLKKLIGKKVRAVRISGVAHDLEVALVGGLRLRVLCTAVNTDADNYSLHATGTVAAVGPQGRVSMKRR